MAKATQREHSIDQTYTSLRRTIGAFHSLHRGAAKGRFTRADAMLLRVIAGQGSTTPKELAQFLGLTQGTITPAIDRLEARGFVKRSRSTKDRRVVVVKATPLARRTWAAMEREARHQLATLFEGWSLREIDTLRGLLDRLSERAWEECGPPPFMRGAKRGPFGRDKD